MRYLITLLVATISFSASSGQSGGNTCHCPETKFADANADTVFKLSNNREIALCGYRSPDNVPPMFSEFVLAECGADTIIGFWGALENCSIDVDNDTLLVHTLVNLPTGRNFIFQMNIWTTDKIFYHKNKRKQQLSVNRQIHKYDENETNTVLRSYEAAEKKISDTTMELINRLFVAAISGSKTAESYFKESKTSFGISDGAYAEEYSNLAAMFALWQSDK